MAADFNKPVTTDTYTNVLAELRDNATALAVGLDPAVVTPGNVPTNAIRWNSASNKWQKWSGVSWGDLSAGYAIPISGASVAATTLSCSGNATLGDAEATDTHAIKGATTLLANSASAALTITQTGAGNAFVVEDSASPDSTPFVIAANGRVLQGSTTEIAIGAISNQNVQFHGNDSLGLMNTSQVTWYAASAISGIQSYARSKSSAIGTHAVVASGDELHTLAFWGSDGTQFIRAGQIAAYVDGTPGTNDMPGRLTFSTTADGSSGPTERMRIGSQGNIGIGTSGSVETGLRVGKVITGGTNAGQLQLTGAVQSDVTASASYYSTSVSTQASAFTLPSLFHYLAAQGTIGAGSTVTSQFGFAAESTLVGATNNYGFYGNIASGAGRWNFYAAGTANNAYAGNSSFGKVTAPTTAVDTTSLAASLVTNTAATYTVLTTDHTIIQTTAASVYTLPSAASFTGRLLHLVTQFAGTVTSASSNVVPLAGGAAGTAILAATAGKFATLQSNGTNWLIIAAN